jgi:hypothetical protein
MEERPGYGGGRVVPAETAEVFVISTPSILRLDKFVQRSADWALAASGKQAIETRRNKDFGYMMTFSLSAANSKR